MCCRVWERTPPTNLVWEFQSEATSSDWPDNLHRQSPSRPGADMSCVINHPRPHPGFAQGSPASSAYLTDLLQRWHKEVIAHYGQGVEHVESLRRTWDREVNEGTCHQGGPAAIPPEPACRDRGQGHGPAWRKAAAPRGLAPSIPSQTKWETEAQRGETLAEQPRGLTLRPRGLVLLPVILKQQLPSNTIAHP